MRLRDLRVSCLAFIACCNAPTATSSSETVIGERDASRPVAPPDAARPTKLEDCQEDFGEGDPEALRLLYPYDGTVFPRGLQAPLVMWDGVTAERVQLRLHSSSFEWRGCFDAVERVAIPQDVWDRAAARTTGKHDPFALELTVRSGTRSYGPIHEELIIAPGSMKGSVFYNSYSSSLAREAGAMGGAILRIPPGGNAQVFLGQRTCVGCHGASADGSRLVTNEGVYALTPETPSNPAPLRMTSSEFPGVSPDGKSFVSNGQLFGTDSGSTTQSMLPLSANELSFSPSGKLAAFIDGGPGPRAQSSLPISIPGLNLPGLQGTRSAAIGDGVSAGQGKLVTARFDGKSFRELTSFKEVSAGAQWPLYLPDERALVFLDAESNDLMILDLGTHKVTPLARAMGFRSLDEARAGKSYLPFADEARQAYYPTVAPIAAGGYFWVFFDSARRYGNVDTTKIESGLAVPDGIDVAQLLPVGLTDLPSKQLWVTAVEIDADGDYTHDPSAPAFFLPGQELGANNHRAFSALDPCLDRGARCDSGTLCCSGFCDDSECVAPPERCANTEEHCTTDADCCTASDRCIQGFCSTLPLI